MFGWITHTHGAEREVPITWKRIVFSLYSILFLIFSTFLFVTPFFFLYFHIGGPTEKKRLRLHRFIFRASNFIIRRVPGTTFTFDNAGGEDFTKPAIIISNHQSHLDLMCILMLSPKLVVLTNDWVYRNPIYGFIIRQAEFYPVSEGLEANIGRLADLVRRGYSIVVFPEGTRSPDCRIQRFHRGAFYLAEQLHLDLLPVFLHGIGHVLPKTDFMLREGAMYMEIGQRIPPGNQEFGNGFKARTSALHRFYQTRFAEICRKRETADYYAWYVWQKYRPQGWPTAKSCRRLLKRNGNFRDIIDHAPEQSRVHIHNSGRGEFALLYALVHRQTEVHAFETDTARHKIADKALARPANLHLHTAAEPLQDADMQYWLNDGRKPAPVPNAVTVDVL